MEDCVCTIEPLLLCIAREYSKKNDFGFILNDFDLFIFLNILFFFLPCIVVYCDFFQITVFV